MATIRRALRPPRAFPQDSIARIFGLGAAHVNPLFDSPGPPSAARGARITGAAAPA